MSLKKKPRLGGSTLMGLLADDVEASDPCNHEAPLTELKTTPPYILPLFSKLAPQILFRTQFVTKLFAK